MLTLRSCALALMAAFLSAGSATASPRAITIVANSGKVAAAQAFQADFTRRTGGRIAVDVRLGGFLGGEGEFLGAVQSGAVDMSIVTGSVIGGMIPTYGVFDVPFLFRDEAHARAVLASPAIATVAAAFPPAGMELLGVGEQGFRDTTNSKGPVTTPADLKGLRIRVIPNDLFKMAFERLGATVVPMDFALLHQALLDGRVDGEENPPASIYQGGFQDAQRYMTLTHHVFGTVGIVMNRQTYATLDEADRAALAESVSAVERTLHDGAEKDNATSLEALKQAGVQVAPSFDRAAFVAAMAPLEPEFEKRFGRDLLTQIRQTH